MSDPDEIESREGTAPLPASQSLPSLNETGIIPPISTGLPAQNPRRRKRIILISCIAMVILHSMLLFFKLYKENLWEEIANPGVRAESVNPTILYALITGHQTNNAPGSFRTSSTQVYQSDIQLTKKRQINIEYRYDLTESGLYDNWWATTAFGTYLLHGSPNSLTASHFQTVEQEKTIFENDSGATFIPLVAKDETEVAIDVVGVPGKLVIASLENKPSISIALPRSNEPYLLKGFDNQRKKLYWSWGKADMFKESHEEIATYTGSGSIRSIEGSPFDFLVQFNPTYDIGYFYDQDKNGLKSIRSYSLKSKKEQVIASASPGEYIDYNMTVSPKGDKVYFMTGIQSGDRHSFHTHDIATKKTSSISLPRQLQLEGGNYISPDGNYVLFRYGPYLCLPDSCTDEHHGKEIILDTTTNKLHILYAPPLNKVRPAFINNSYSEVEKFKFIGWLATDEKTSTGIDSLPEFVF